MSFQRSVFCPRARCLLEYSDFLAWCLAFYDQAWNLNQPLCLCKSLNDNIVGVGKFSMAPFVKACPKIGVSVLTASLRWSLLSASALAGPPSCPWPPYSPTTSSPIPVTTQRSQIKTHKFVQCNVTRWESKSKIKTHASNNVIKWEGGDSACLSLKFISEVVSWQGL